MAHVRWAGDVGATLRDAAAIDLRDDEALLVSDSDGRVMGADPGGVLGLDADAMADPDLPCPPPTRPITGHAALTLVSSLASGGAASWVLLESAA